MRGGIAVVSWRICSMRVSSSAVVSAVASVAGADSNRRRLRLCQNLEAFELRGSELHHVETDPTRVLERDWRFPFLSPVLLPDFFVKLMTSRFEHDSGFSSPLLKYSFDRHHLAIPRR